MLINGPEAATKARRLTARPAHRSADSPTSGYTARPVSHQPTRAPAGQSTVLPASNFVAVSQTARPCTNPESVPKKLASPTLARPSCLRETFVYATVCSARRRRLQPPSRTCIRMADAMTAMSSKLSVGVILMVPPFADCCLPFFYSDHRALSLTTGAGQRRIGRLHTGWQQYSNWQAAWSPLRLSVPAMKTAVPMGTAAFPAGTG